MQNADTFWFMAGLAAAGAIASATIRNRTGWVKYWPWVFGAVSLLLLWLSLKLIDPVRVTVGFAITTALQFAYIKAFGAVLRSVENQKPGK